MNRTLRHFALKSWKLALAALLLHSGELLSQTQEAPSPVYDSAIPAISNNYPLTEDSKPHPGVPAGKTFDFMLQNSKLFPGTKQKIVVYVPAEYDSAHAACLYVGMDGLQNHLQAVFDNLIAKKEMPVTIAIGVTPGVVDSSSADENPRLQRSLEFDTRSDRFARFLIEEVLPAVQSRTTPRGDRIVISADPNDRSIGGASTGGIGAFTVAWERPDAFRRGFISIGTFVGMRGGEQYYVQVRKTEPKPLRIYMQDGANDEWPGGPEMGDWFMSNLTMNRALEFAGYDVKHVWGAGTHNGNQANAVFPDAMRWLWRGYPTPLQAQPPGNPRLNEIALPGENWQLAAGGSAGNALAADTQGVVSLRDAGAMELRRVDLDASSAPCATVASTGSGTAFAFGPDGSRYLALASGGIRITAAGGASRTVAADLQVHSLAPVLSFLVVTVPPPFTMNTDCVSTTTVRVTCGYGAG